MKALKEANTQCVGRTFVLANSLGASPLSLGLTFAGSFSLRVREEDLGWVFFRDADFVATPLDTSKRLAFIEREAERRGGVTSSGMLNLTSFSVGAS